MIEEALAEWLAHHNSADLALFADANVLKQWVPSALLNDTYNAKAKTVLNLLIGSLDFEKVKSELILKKVKET